MSGAMGPKGARGSEARPREHLIVVWGEEEVPWAFQTDLATAKRAVAEATPPLPVRCLHPTCGSIGEVWSVGSWTWGPDLGGGEAIAADVVLADNVPVEHAFPKLRLVAEWKDGRLVGFLAHSH
jgi:hypothetical protein